MHCIEIPEAVAVYVAQVPLVYHVPALIKQPLPPPLVIAFKYPVPENGAPVGEDPGTVVVGVPPPPDLGRYLMPVEGQSLFSPTGPALTNVPVCTEPRT